MTKRNLNFLASIDFAQLLSKRPFLLSFLFSFFPSFFLSFSFCISFYSFSFFFAHASYAQEVQIKLDPENPRVDESFVLHFTLTGEGVSGAEISFDTPGLRRLSGGSTSYRDYVSYDNGELKRSSESVYSYELLAEKAGDYKVSNIKVNLQARTLARPDFSFKVLEKSTRSQSQNQGANRGQGVFDRMQNFLDRHTNPAPDTNADHPEVFLKSISSKTSVYEGEGFDLDYYIYFNRPILGFTPKDYPQLAGLVKRYKNSQGREERVDYNGVIYRRIPIHSLRVFAQKSGKAQVELMQAEAQIQERTSRSFFSFPSMQTLNLKSEALEIEVLEVPEKEKNPTFTGLIGEHSFQLFVNRNKVLVNDVIEATLSVEGPGLLEDYDAPQIYVSEHLDEFDVKSEFVETARGAKKTFSYTYLAKSNGVIPDRVLSLSYFDPEKKEYVSQDIDVAGLIIGGGQTASQSEEGQDRDSDNDASDESQNLESTINEGKNLFASILPYLNIILGVILLALGVFFIIKKIKHRRGPKQLEFLKLQKEIEVTGPSYWRLYKLFSLVTKETLADSALIKSSSSKDLGKSLKNSFEKTQEYSLPEMITNLNVSANAREYFKGLALQGESDDYAGAKTDTLSFKFEQKYFKEVYKLLKDKN